MQKCYIIVPGTPVIISDAVSEFLLVILRLASITSITEDFVTEKLGFSEDMTRTLFDKLVDYGLIGNTDVHPDIFAISEKGRELLAKNQEEDKIYREEMIDIRLAVTDDPHFVLYNHWHYPPKTDIEITAENSSIITQELLEGRKDYSNLHENIKCIVNKPELMSITRSELGFDLRENLPPHVLVTSRKGKEKTIQVKADDPDLVGIHSDLWNALQPGKSRTTIENKIRRELPFPEITSEIENLVGDECTLSLALEKKQLTTSDHMSWIRWLEKHDWNMDTFILPVSINNGWNVDLTVDLIIKDSSLLVGMFCRYITGERQILEKLLKSYRFTDLLEELWTDFKHNYQCKGSIDKETLFSVLWASGAEGKLVAGKMNEEEVFELG
ncbi:MAG: hypothetical protein ACFFD4_20610 [Candidatus Odinarchaeota archaeon]